MTSALDRLRRLAAGRSKDVSAAEKRVADQAAVLAELRRDRDKLAADVAQFEDEVAKAQRPADARPMVEKLTDARWRLSVLDGAIEAKGRALAGAQGAAETVAEASLAQERARLLEAITAEAEGARSRARALVFEDLVPCAARILDLARAYREAGGDALPFDGQTDRNLAREALNEMALALGPNAQILGFDDGRTQAEVRRFRGLP